MSESTPLTSRESICPLCGQPNECGARNATCWCFNLKMDAAILEQIPEAQRNMACICQKCATRRTDQSG